MDLDLHFTRWESVRKGLYQLLDTLNPADLDFKPYNTSWSVREIFLHLASTEEGWLRYVVLKESDQWVDFQPEDYVDKVAIWKLLEETHGKILRWRGCLGPDDLTRIIESPWDSEFTIGWVLWHLQEHEIHHRGELSLILGMLGKKGLDV
jgi:uncharacterized damage-inducible protein DinB